MQHTKCELLACEASKLLDEMYRNGGVYPSSVLFDKYTGILDRISLEPAEDGYNCALELMVKIYYMRDAGDCLFANLLLDKTYCSLRKIPKDASVSTICIYGKNDGYFKI